MRERHAVESPKSLYLILRVVEYVYNMHACHVMHQGKGRGKKFKKVKEKKEKRWKKVDGVRKVEGTGKERFTVDETGVQVNV